MRKFEKSFYWGLVASLLMIGWYCYSLSNSQNFSYSDQVYVWQRVWPEGLEQEIAKKTNKTKGFERAVILAAEFEYNEKEEEWKVQWFDAPLNYALTHDDVEVSIRISASVAQTLWPESVVRSFLEELEYLPGKLETLQVDYDCPSSKLNDYARLLSVMGVLDVADQIEITCLPDWLKYSDFERLIEQAHSYVMQVHGVLGYGNEGQLCNIREARRIAVQCSKYECPFLIALPTYRHALEFGEENKVLSVVSEGAVLRPASRYQILSANAEELSELVAEWRLETPDWMKGVIWFRLPVNRDRMNWTDETFEKVREGSFEKTPLLVSFKRDGKGLFEIFLENLSDDRMDWPNEISLNWVDAFLITADAMGAYELVIEDRLEKAVFKWRANTLESIEPKQSIKVGWLLLGKEVDLEVELID